MSRNTKPTVKDNGRRSYAEVVKLQPQDEHEKNEREMI